MALLSARARRSGRTDPLNEMEDKNGVLSFGEIADTFATKELAGLLYALADLVRPQTAWCVEAPDDPASYIAALDACLNDDPAERCENAFALVRERHSWSHFRNSVYQTLDEIGVQLGAPPTSSPSASAT